MASVVKAVAAKTKTIWNKDMLPLRLLATPEQRANISRFGYVNDELVSTSWLAVSHFLKIKLPCWN
jgi:hypothetical protein